MDRCGCSLLTSTELLERPTQTISGKKINLQICAKFLDFFLLSLVIGDDCANRGMAEKIREVIAQTGVMIEKIGEMIAQVGVMAEKNGGMIAQAGVVAEKNGEMIAQTEVVVEKKKEMIVQAGGWLRRLGNDSAYRGTAAQVGEGLRKRGMIVRKRKINVIIQ